MGKNGHFACDCIKPKKVFVAHTLTHRYVCSYALVANSTLECIIDTGANKHVVRDKVGFVDYHQLSKGIQFVDFGNREK